MLRLDAFRPELARDETLVLQLPYVPGESPRPVAFAERYCEDPDCECHRANIRVVDLTDGNDLATIVHRFAETADSSPAGDPTYLDRLCLEDRHTRLMLGIVRYLVEHHDYRRRLQTHYEAFKDVVHRREQADTGPDIPEDTGRNDPCPCGSGRKFKKCCLRKQKQATDDIPRHHDLSLDEFYAPWRRRADSIEQLDRFFEVLNDAELAGDGEFDVARRIVDGFEIDVDQDDLVEMLQQGDSPDLVAENFARRTDGEFRDAPELVTPVLSGVIDTLMTHWTHDTILPRNVASGIDAGYLLVDDDPGTTLTRWALTWTDLTTWLDEDDNLNAEAGLIDQLETLVDADESLRHWLRDLAETARQRVEATGENVRPAEVLPDCLELMEQIEEVFAESDPAVANDAAVNRYYALLKLERTDEATEVLETIAGRPTDDLFAPLFIGDIYEIWGHDPARRHLELAVEFCESTLELCSDTDRSMLEEIHQSLVDRLEDLDAR